MNTEELGTAGYCAVVLNNIQLLQFDKKYGGVYLRYEGVQSYSLICGNISWTRNKMNLLA